MRLNQITLPSVSVAESRDFYVRLGFTLIVDSAPHYVRLEAPAGGTTLSLHEAAAASSGPQAVIYLESDVLEHDIERLKKAGIVFFQEARGESWLWREARLKDPDGYEICLYHAGENRLNPPWRVKPGP